MISRGNVLALAFALLVMGCTGSDGAPERTPGDPSAASVTTSGAPAAPYPGAGQDCPTTEPSPVGVEEAIRALRAEGFNVSALERSCGLRTISAVITNGNGSLTHGVMAREGLVWCFVLALRDSEALDDVDGATSAAHAERRLANVECDLYGADSSGFEDDVLRLDRAFQKLRRATAG